MYQFEETQQFRQWWIWLVIFLSAVLPFSAAIIKTSDSDPLASTENIIFIVVMPIIIITFFLLLKLKTRIDSSGIHYQFRPIHLKQQTILWDDIATVEIRKYNPIREYGGWGIRETTKNGKAFNVKGDVGLQLVLKNGKKILIGTQKAEEIRMVLRDLGKL
jgi:hypothetical protein